jgi:hypothetical protein
MVPATIRILVAFEPYMYREVLAHQLRQERPRSEVILGSPDTLRDEAERTKPHLIVANVVPPELKEKDSLCWVELSADDRLDANIRANGYSDTIHDVSLEDLVAVVDKVEEVTRNE